MFKENRHVIIFYSVVALLIIAALIYYLPRSTPINLNMDAVRLDAEGNQVGTTRISIKGYYRDYLFQADRLDLDITPFDGFTFSNDVESGNHGGYGAITYYDFLDYSQVIYSAANEELYSADSAFEAVSTIFFDEDLNRWCFRMMPWGDGDIVHYVASADKSDSTEALLEFFKVVVPKNAPADSKQ